MPRSYVYLGVDPVTGKQIRKWISYSTDKDLQNKRDAILIGYSSGKLSAKDIRFSTYAQTWLDANYPVKKTNPNTRRMYAGAIKSLISRFGAMKLSMIREINVRQYLADRASRTAQIELAVMRQICKSARRNQYLATDPTEDIRITYEAPKKREIEQFERNAINSAKLSAKERAYLLLTLRCGLRKGEVLALNCSDITDRVSVTKSAVVGLKGMMINPVPKTRSGNRSIPIPEDALSVIQNYAKTIQDGTPLFGTMRRQSYWRFWRHIVAMVNDAAGGKSRFDDKKRYRVIDEWMIKQPFSAHIMRHSYCCDLVRHGYNLNEIKYLMGHSKITVSLDVYTHVKGEAITAQKLNAKKLSLVGKLPYRTDVKVAPLLQLTAKLASET